MVEGDELRRTMVVSISVVVAKLQLGVNAVGADMPALLVVVRATDIETVFLRLKTPFL